MHDEVIDTATDEVVGAPANFVKKGRPTTGRVQAVSSTSRMIIIYIRLLYMMNQSEHK